MRSQLRVLLADDEASLREPLAKHLRQEHGYHVDTAADGQEVLARLEQAQGQYDVALLDDLLIPAPGREPEPLGVTLTTEIKARYPHLQVIVFTGWGMKSGLEALRAGAYRYLAKPFNLEELSMLLQTAAEHSRLKGVAHEKQILEQLMKTSVALISGRSLPEVLDTILRSVQNIGFDRVCLYLLSEDRQTMVGQAQVGMDTDFVGHERPLATDVHMQYLLAEPRPQVFEREDDKPLPFEQELGREGVNEWACVPLILQGEVIGKLSLDNKHNRSPIVESELGPVALFASLAAAAIENARLRDKEKVATEKAKQRARNIAAVQKVSTAISSTLVLDKILEATCKAAVELFSVDHSGLVLFEEPDYERGQVVAEYPDLGTCGLEIPIRGVPAAEQFLASQEPVVLADIPHELSLGPTRGIMGGFDIRSALIVPVMVKGRMLGSFGLDAIGEARVFTDEEVELCKIFAAQVAVAIENARTHKSIKRYTEKLEILHEIDTEVAAALEVDHVLNSIARNVVRLVGAERSLFLLVDANRRRLVKVTGYNYPPEHLQLLAIEEVKAGVSGWVLETGKPVLVADAQSDPRNMGIAEKRSRQFETSPLIVAPLLVKGEVIGTLTAVNTSDDPPFSEEDLKLVVMLANRAASAVDNARLFEETRQGLARLRSVSEAGRVLISTLDPVQVLQVIVEEAWQAVQAWRVSVVLIDDGRSSELAAVGYEHTSEVSAIVRPDGISMQVLTSGKPRVVEDVAAYRAEVNPDVIGDAVGAAVCLPLSLRERNIGVVWIQFKEARSISETELEALRIYTEGAAIAYDNARRLQELEHMRQAAEALSGAARPQEVLKQIVQSACKVLQADSAAILSYDAVRDQFILESWVAVGIPPEIWKKFRKSGPRPGGTAYTIMEEGWVGVTNADDLRQYKFLGGATHHLLERIGAQSFQGIALTVGGEKLGVLYVNYNRPRSFSEEERETARTFANHAVLALKKARLFDQVSKARNAARVVAEATVLENLQSTLVSIVKRTRDVLGCDVVTLYTYDQDRNELGFPPAMVGVRYPERVLGLGKIAPGSVVYDVLTHNGLYEVGTSSDDPLLNSPFARREGIVSSVGIPLATKDRKVGVMFVNYRQLHRFTDDELTNIELFANQSAVAIRNAQLYQQVQKRAGALQALYEAGRAMTGSLKLNEILPRIAEQAYRLMGTREKEVRFSHLALVDGLTLRFEATYPLEQLPGLRQRVGDIHLELADRIGVTGRAVKAGEAQLVGDITEDPEYIEYDSDTRSELAVPIKLGDEVIGVINVEYSDYNAFDKEDQQALESLAAQAAIAIQNAYLFEASQRHTRLLDASAQVAHGATGILDVDKLLSETVRLITERFNFYHAAVFLINKDSHYVILKAAFPKDDQRMLKVDHKLRVGREGIVGRVAQIGEPHLAPDVDEDPYYLPNLPLTRAEIAFPLTARGRVIGVLDVQSDKIGDWRDEDIATLQTMADQLANAIHNAQLYQQATQRLEEIKALRQVAVSLAGASDLKEVLEVIAVEAMKLTNTRETSILLWDGQAEKFTQALRIDERGGLKEYVTTARPQGGRTRMIIDTKKTIAISDARQVEDFDPDFIAKGHRATLGTPLLCRGEPVGVLYVRDDEPHQFTERQVALFEGLASQAAVAIERARQYDELKQTMGLVSARTAVAWMGMVSAAWRHVIEGHAMTIREEVGHLRADSTPEDIDRIEGRLAKIERLAQLILEKPITPPLSEEEGVGSVSVNDLLCERIRQLWENEPYSSVEHELAFDLDKAATVRASSEWLRRAFDILIDNAIDAMGNISTPTLCISTRAEGASAEIVFADNGRGIPKEIQPKLFHEPIKKPKGSEGLGIGLLMAQTILQTYGGEIRLEASDHTGTTMIVVLPIESHNALETWPQETYR